MPTEITIVIPATEEEDLSASDNENVPLSNRGQRSGTSSTDIATASSFVNDTTKPTGNDRKGTGNDRKGTGNDRKGTGNDRIRSRTGRYSQSKNATRVCQKKSSGNGKDKPTIGRRQTSQLHYLNDDLDKTYNVVLDRQLFRPVTKPDKVEDKPTKPQGIHVSITGSYDIDLEHQEIMVKALRAYSRHRNSDVILGDAIPTSAKATACVNRKVSDTLKAALTNHSKTTPYESDPNILLPNYASGFKLSQCRLRFFDDSDDINTLTSVPSGKGPSFSTKRRPLSTSASATVAAIPTLYQLEESDGILVDAVGHVYKSKRLRPWTPCPMKNTENIILQKENTHQPQSPRSSEVQPPVSSSLSSKPINRRKSVPSPGQPVRAASVRMDIPQPSKSFQRRNMTTHLWTDGSQLMSRSMPTSSFLHQRYNSSFPTSPRSSRDTASEKTSPVAGKQANARPSSSYSYDGGFFLGAHSGQAEYFVIHPDWVSEAVTIKKLSVGNKTVGAPVAKSASFKSGIWSGRRCLSAPPAKRRNPITWESLDSNGVPDKQF
ncbi:hypothetical protein BgiMline_001070 [Biomphalaria glabrata]|nr:hypothetical protein BgiMline_000993 [Biomphalaria glabrata]